MTRSSQYPFDSLTVGNYFVVGEHYQHARVAASEFGRKHGMVFSCRMQPDRTMRVYRVERSQASVDQRGRSGRREIPVDASKAILQPTKAQFCGWLATFTPGQSFAMPKDYSASFLLMQAWCEVHSLRTGIEYRTGLQSDGTLLIARSN